MWKFGKILKELDLINGQREKTIDGIHAEASVSPNAVIESSIIGRGVKISEGAYIEGSVLMEGVEVGNNVRIEGSIVGERVKVEERSEILELTIINHEETVERGSKLRSAIYQNRINR